MAIPLAVQLYSLREAAAEDFPAVLKDVAAMGYKGVETAGLNGMTAAEVKAMLDDLGLAVAGCHCPLPAAENISQAVDECGALGTTCIVTGFGPDDYQTEQAAKDNTARIQAAAALAAENGLQLGYHNHWWEFDKNFGGRTPHEILMAGAPDVFAEIDVYWVKFGGGDPAEVVARLSSRAPLLHIKDGNLTPDHIHTAVGAGKLDIPRIIGAADPAVTQWLIVELDNCATDMAGAVRQSAEYLTSNGLAEGR